MALEVAAQTPARMSIANVSSGESIEAQFNPTELEEALEVNWARQTVPGLSHQPLQFVNTGNLKFTLELQFEARSATADIDRNLQARRFLQSLCYPRRGAANVAGGGPPRVLFVWPTFVSLTCVIASLSFKYSRFNLAATPIQFSAKLALEEIRDVRLLSEDVLANGTQRSGASNGAT
ncbi:MAG: peptidoglycan-binding protein [Deltaproteobacteria bacterium]|nr:MAG: peptidoglycan-binding protein [Deltaproteobacteria bacterium]TMQ13297.1 MAG: peptidoglycan-binding protein [Deltaproteobacteria bacterium]